MPPTATGTAANRSRTPRASRRARTRRAVAFGAALCAALAAGSPASDVALDEDLTLGVWSPQRSRYVAVAPACISRSPGEPPGAYRVRVSGTATDRFALANSVGDEIRYEVRWLGGGPGSGERLRPGADSARSWPLLDRADCVAGDGPSLRAKARRRDVDRAPPGVYRDTLTLIVSPL